MGLSESVIRKKRLVVNFNLKIGSLWGVDLSILSSGLQVVIYRVCY